MIWLYRILFIPLFLFLFPRYYLRMRRRGGYREGFGTRFGNVEGLPPKKDGVRRIWLQAVSVGEIFAAGPILRALARDPSAEVFLTTTTSTGYRLAKERYRDQLIGLAYFPLDFLPFSRKTWNRVQPDLCLLMEAELWPEHIHQARRRGVPLLLINARMSDRSFTRLSLVSFLTSRLLNRFERVLSASEADRERFLSLGADPVRIETTGNIKLDVNLEPLLDHARKAHLLHELGLTPLGASPTPDQTEPSPPLILLGSSTWPGEEAALLHVLEKAHAAGIPCRLLIVPRHMERRDEIRKTLEGYPFTFHFRTEGPAPKAVEVAVADTTGELLLFTQLADLVFVGKSLAPNHGGQTPIEAAALGKTLLYGPFMTNFREIARELVDADAAVVVGDDVDLAEQALILLKDENRRSEIAGNALKWHAANRGAVQKTLATIRSVLNRDRQSNC